MVKSFKILNVFDTEVIFRWKHTGQHWHIFPVSGIPALWMHLGTRFKMASWHYMVSEVGYENLQILQSIAAIRTWKLITTQIWLPYHLNIFILIGIALICTKNLAVIETTPSSCLLDHSVNNRRMNKTVGWEHGSDFKVEKFTRQSSPGMKVRRKILWKFRIS